MPKRPTKSPKFSELYRFEAPVKGAFQDADGPRQIAKNKVSLKVKGAYHRNPAYKPILQLSSV